MPMTANRYDDKSKRADKILIKDSFYNDLDKFYQKNSLGMVKVS